MDSSVDGFPRSLHHKAWFCKCIQDSCHVHCQLFSSQPRNLILHHHHHHHHHHQATTYHFSISLCFTCNPTGLFRKCSPSFRSRSSSISLTMESMSMLVKTRYCHYSTFFY